MAFFPRYGKKFTNKELFDYTSAEITVVREAKVPSLERCLRNLNRKLNDDHTRENPDDDRWYQDVPSPDFLEEVKRNLLRGCEDIVALLRSQGVTRTTTDEGVQFVGQTSTCPECKKNIVHLKEHLTTVHDWSAVRYVKWKGTKAMVDRRPDKYCTLEGCSWKDMRLDMHLKSNHRMTSASPQYRQLLLAGQRSPSATSTVTQIDTSSSLSASPTTSTAVASQRKRTRSASPTPTTAVASKKKGTPSALPTRTTAMASQKKGTPSASPTTITGVATEINKKQEREPEIDQLDSDEELCTFLVKKKLVLQSSEEEDQEQEQSGDDDDYGFDGGDDDDGDGDDSDNGDDADDDGGDDMSDEDPEGEFSTEENVEEEDKGRGKYGQACKPVNVIEVLIKGWNQHLAMPDGGCKPPHVIKQMCQQIETIYEEIGRPKELTDVFDKDVIYERFFKAKMEMRKADKSKGMTVNTLLVYINRFRQFAQYVVQSCDLNKEMKTVTHKLIDALPGWRESVKKIRMEETSTRQWEERKILPKPDEIVEMKRCAYAQYCRKLLREPREDPYTLEQAVDARNFLVFRICLENGSRAGPIHALTSHDMGNSERLEGKRVVHIAKHKTTAAYGGALLNLSDDLYQDIWSFIRGARLVFVKEGLPKVDNVFLGQYGNPISPSYVHRALKAFAKKTLIVHESVVDKFCSTMLRKICVTHTRDQTTAQKTNIATLMVHSTTTAERSYSLQNRIEQSSSGHDAVRALFGSPKKTVQEDDDTTSSTNTVPPSVTTTALEEEIVKSVSRIARRLTWSKKDEVDILKSASAIICGLGASTKSNIIKTINYSTTVTEIAQREGMERLFEKIKAMKKKTENPIANVFTVLWLGNVVLVDCDTNSLPSISNGRHEKVVMIIIR
ncbi:hypothetical protein QZH41_000077 [Actinostola sp. cb2023]|nr:hypothetical protein QZH41_000077 [Actinostola sp. cb2023]